MKLILRTISPLHIGSGNSLNFLDFVEHQKAPSSESLRNSFLPFSRPSPNATRAISSLCRLDEWYQQPDNRGPEEERRKAKRNKRDINRDLTEDSQIISD